MWLYLGTESVHVRIPKEKVDFINRLVASGRYKNTTAFIVEAVTELVSQFSGEPTIRHIDNKIQVIQHRLNVIEPNVTKLIELHREEFK